VIKMSKKMCKLFKEINKKEIMEKYIKNVKNPKYMCMNCGRTAKKEELICKPLVLKND